MLPAATVPAVRSSVTVPEGGPRASRRELRRRRGPVRDAEAGLAEVTAMPALWRDGEGRVLERPGPGAGVVVCGALPGAPAPRPAWTAAELAAAGVAAAPGPVRDSAGLGLLSAVFTPQLLGQVLAGVPSRRARKVTPRLAITLGWHGRWTRRQARPGR